MEEALGISRNLGDRRGEADALNRLGGVRRLTKDYRGPPPLLKRRWASAHDHMLADLDRFDGLDGQWRGGEAVPDDAHRLLPPVTA